MRDFDTDTRAALPPGTAAAPDPTVLRLPAGALLLVAGVPGAGKTTLLARLDSAPAHVLDPEPIRARYARWLRPLPYRLWRPLVHGEHYLRVLLALPGASGSPSRPGACPLPPRGRGATGPPCAARCWRCCSRWPRWRRSRVSSWRRGEQPGPAARRSGR